MLGLLLVCALKYFGVVGSERSVDANVAGRLIVDLCMFCAICLGRPGLVSENCLCEEPLCQSGKGGHSMTAFEAQSLSSPFIYVTVNYILNTPNLVFPGSTSFFPTVLPSDQAPDTYAYVAVELHHHPVQLSVPFHMAREAKETYPYPCRRIDSVALLFYPILQLRVGFLSYSLHDIR